MPIAQWNQNYPSSLSGPNGRGVWDFLIGKPGTSESPSVVTPASSSLPSPQSFSDSSVGAGNDAGAALRSPAIKPSGQASVPVDAVSTNTPGPSLPMPDYIASNPGYAQEITALSNGYSPLVDGVYSRSNTLSPGTPGYQDAMRSRIGGSFAGGSEPLYARDYMSQAGTANGISSVAPGRGSVSAPDQGNGGTIEGNVAAINRQTDALRSLRESRNPGVTTGNAGAFGDLVSIGAPGQSYGDDILARDRFLRQFSKPRDRLAAQTLQNQSDNQAADLASRQKIAQGVQQASTLQHLLNAQAKAAQQQFDIGKWNQQYGLDINRYNLDARRAQNDATYKAAQMGQLSQRTPQQQKAYLADLITNTQLELQKNPDPAGQGYLDMLKKTYWDLGFAHDPTNPLLALSPDQSAN